MIVHVLKPLAPSPSPRAAWLTLAVDELKWVTAGFSLLTEILLLFPHVTELSFLKSQPAGKGPHTASLGIRHRFQGILLIGISLPSLA